MLSQWLQHRHGAVLRGSLIRLSPAGLLRVSMADDSRPVRVLLPVQHGGQAAVARAEFGDVDQSPSLALRVQAVSSEEEKLRQMERLMSMLSVVTAARENPQVYPAVLPVAESFVLTVPAAQIPSTRSTGEHELWCDVMAWCDRNLAERHEADKLAARALDVVVPRLLPVFATVHAVHENLGVIHRDITPNNVLIDEAGRLQLADWGIAHVLAPNKTSTYTQRAGNVGYAIPPETVRGEKAIGRYTDSWYLGCLLVWMLTGQLPGPEGANQLPAGLPAGPVGERVEVVVRGLCHVDPRVRMGLPEASARLAELVGGPPVVVHGPVPAPRAQPSGELPRGPRAHPAGSAPVQPLAPAALLVAPEQPVTTVRGRLSSDLDDGLRPVGAASRRPYLWVVAVVVVVVLAALVVVFVASRNDRPGAWNPAHGPVSTAQPEAAQVGRGFAPSPWSPGSPAVVLAQVPSRDCAHDGVARIVD
ncbi:MAG: protein kinase [Micrococcales bacterium]|nr:protein kinase [Micrococcales bacterium]MCL2667823.1 protein kinase [Micrococcales bacterium]